MTRREAYTKGQLTYQGSDCPYGHGGDRYTRTNDCVACSKRRSQQSKDKFRGAYELGAAQEFNQVETSKS